MSSSSSSSNSSSSKPQPVLVVEDNEQDFETIQRAFQSLRLANPVFRCADGDEALDYLFRQNAFADPQQSPRPGFILLDLNLPGTDGREVLNEIKKVPELRRIPVIVLTTSSDEQDINACYDVGANSYVQKPVTVESFLTSLQRLTEYWIEIALLPRGSTGP